MLSGHFNAKTSKTPNEFTRKVSIFRGLVSPGQVFWNWTNQDRTQSQNTYNEISIQRSRHAHVYLEVQFDVDL
jgi:hypothetical protein